MKPIDKKRKDERLGKPGRSFEPSPLNKRKDRSKERGNERTLLGYELDSDWPFSTSMTLKRQK